MEVLCSSSVGSEEQLNPDLLAGQFPSAKHGRGPPVFGSAQRSTVEVFDSSGASVEEVMPQQSSAVNRKYSLHRGLHLI